MKARILPISEVVRVVDVALESGDAKDSSHLRFRLELHRRMDKSDGYFARLYRIDRYRMRPWLPDGSREGDHLEADELVAVEEECLLSPAETASGDRAEPLRIALRHLEQQFSADVSSCRSFVDNVE